MSEGDIERAVAELARGGAVVYPTETVYGLGVDPANEAAMELLFALKGGRRGSGISLLVEGIETAERLCEGGLRGAARRLAERFWPGPLTLIVPASRMVPQAAVGPTGGVGLRCSSDPVAAELVAAAGRPITATSANPTGRPPAASVAEARRYFRERVAVYLDGGPRAIEQVSTVVEFLGGRAYLRRSGAIGADAIAAVVPSLEQSIG